MLNSSGCPEGCPYVGFSHVLAAESGSPMRKAIFLHHNSIQHGKCFHESGKNLFPIPGSRPKTWSECLFEQA